MKQLEKARKKASSIMAGLEGEGMATLTELKRLLEIEIQNRVKEASPGEEIPRAHFGVDRVFARVGDPRQKEAAT